MKAIVIFDIDGVLRDVSQSYRRALADTVEQFTQGAIRPSQAEIDALKAEGIWNNDWEGSRELVYRYFESQGRSRSQLALDYEELVAFFQSKYRGADPTNPDRWTGYISQEPLLVQPPYFEQLTRSAIAWGFFSGATRGSANYVLQRRLQIAAPTLVAMEDAPGKPDPTGLIDVVEQLQNHFSLGTTVPVIYAGDTVADLYTVRHAEELYPSRRWIGVGVLPPHVQTSDYKADYSRMLQEAGAKVVLETIAALNSEQIDRLIEFSLIT